MNNSWLMKSEHALKAEGKVIEALSESLFRVELSNGHRLYARLPRKAPKGLPLPKPGDILRLELTPFDLSKARIVY